MVGRALLCLLAVSLAQGKVDSISSSISSILSNPSPLYNLIGLREQRVSTDDWDKEFDIPLIGLHLKVKWVDATNIFKGGRVFIEFPIPKMLTYFTKGVNDVQLDIVFLGKDITQGLFEVKMGYKMTTTTAEVMEGSVMVVRELTGNKYTTKVVVNGKEMEILDIVVDTDYQHKFYMALNFGGKLYELRINRVRGSSFIVAVTLDGVPYTTVTTFNLASGIVSFHCSINKVEKYQGEIILNPLSQEWGVILVGDVNGPLDCRVALQKDLKFAQVSVNYNRVNYVFVDVEGKMQMSYSSIIPLYLKYSVTYDLHHLLQTVYSVVPVDVKELLMHDLHLTVLNEGKAKVNYNGVEEEKVLTVKLAPKKGHSYIWEMKGKMDADFSYNLYHELVSNKVTYYTMSHTHTVATFTTDKWMSMMKDKCTVPKASPLYSMLESTYLGKLLFNMQRKASISADLRIKNGLMVPKIDYRDVVMTNREKHMEILLNTQKTPFSVSIYYPTGPEIYGHNLGMKHILNQDSASASITLTPNMEMTVKTNIYNIKISLRGPHKDFKPLVSAEVTYTEKNEKAFDFILNKEGSIVKVNLFSSFFTPKSFSVCTEGETCFSQWSGYLNFEVDLAKMLVYSVVPSHSLSMGITKDFESLIEMKMLMTQSPYMISVSCPKMLSKPVTIEAVEETSGSLVVKLSEYIGQDIKISTVGTMTTISYAETPLAHLELDFTSKTISYSMLDLDTPTITVTYAESGSIFKNEIVVDIVLPKLGNVLNINVDYNIKSLYESTLKAILTGEVPVVGKYYLTNNFFYLIAGTTGKVNYQGSAQFTTGPLSILPPTTSSVTTSYNLDTYMVQSAVMATVADKTVGVKVVDNKIVLVY